METDKHDDLRLWIEMRDAAFSVVLLTVRQDGLWSFPTAQSELDTHYAPEGSADYKDRKHGHFGHSSITVSLNALLNLEAALGCRPTFAAQPVLVALNSCRHRSGGYGSPTLRRYAGEVTPVARHTAAAIAILCLFGSGDEDSLRNLEQPVKWLIEHARQEGGWAYDGASSELGTQSTALSIAALCFYLDAVKRLPKFGSGVAEATITPIARAAYRSLIAQAESGIWVGQEDGIPQERQLVDSAFNLWMLSRANETGTLRRIVGQDVAALSNLVTQLDSLRRQRGWPGYPNALSDQAAATISALSLLEAQQDGSSDERKSGWQAAEEYLLEYWRQGALARSLTMWDWGCLLRLGSMKAGLLNESEWSRILTESDRVRLRWRAGTLTSSALERLPKGAKDTVTFSLTEGDADRLNPTFARRCARQLRRIGISTIWPIVTSLIAAVVFYFLAQRTGWVK